MSSLTEGNANLFAGLSFRVSPFGGESSGWVLGWDSHG